jgi:hypothetical protein
MLGAKPSRVATERISDSLGEPTNGHTNGAPITHSVDLGSHVLQISVAPHPRSKRNTNGAAKSDNQGTDRSVITPV